MGAPMTPPRPGGHPDHADQRPGSWGGAFPPGAAFDGGGRPPGAPAHLAGGPPRDGQGGPGEAPRAGGGFRGFWTSLPGVLTAVAAVVTAAGGILLGTGRTDHRNTPVTAEPPLVVVAQDLGVDDLVEPAPTTYADYMTVSDDSGTVIVDVPVEWAEVDGAPIELADGTLVADVAASSDLDAFIETWDAPGVEVSATDTSVIDVPTAMREFAPPDCTSAGTEPYDDAVFAGQIAFSTGCGGTDTIHVLVAASYKPEPERIALVQAQVLSDADVDAVVRVLETFDFAA
jgi:hypothetical protein